MPDSFPCRHETYTVQYEQQRYGSETSTHTSNIVRSGWLKEFGALDLNPHFWIFTSGSVGSSPRFYLFTSATARSEHICLHCDEE